MINSKNYLSQRTVKAQGILKTSPLTLKIYSIAKNEHPKNEIIKNVKNLLEKEIADKKIASLSGFGFAILSEETILNFIRWEIYQSTIRIRSQNYLTRFAGKTQLIALDNPIFGSFDAWELRVANYEKESLMKYLNSPQKLYDLDRYLTDVIEGKL